MGRLDLASTAAASVCRAGTCSAEPRNARHRPCRVLDAAGAVAPVSWVTARPGSVQRDARRDPAGPGAVADLVRPGARFASGARLSVGGRARVRRTRARPTDHWGTARVWRRRSLGHEAAAAHETRTARGRAIDRLRFSRHTRDPRRRESTLGADLVRERRPRRASRGAVPTLLLATSEPEAVEQARHVASPDSPTRSSRGTWEGAGVVTSGHVLDGRSRPFLDAIRRFLGARRGRRRSTRSCRPSCSRTSSIRRRRQAELGDARLEGTGARTSRQPCARRSRAGEGWRTTPPGDGFYATFDGPARAIRCAQEITEPCPCPRHRGSGWASTPASAN